jgi:DNA (cytosine-5)-methyltransferase 1
MKHGSLFSGIGGFELAADWMGWENVFHCEKEPFGQRVLNHYWPESKCYEDVTVTDFRIWRGELDLLTGGFPCQPYSAAGKRLGKEDDRHLWPHMLRAIREICPRWIVGENVRGLVSWNDGMVFDEVQADLEAAGYEVQPFILPACAVNAPHRRDRVWFVAHTKGAGSPQLGSTTKAREQVQATRHANGQNDKGAAPDPDHRLSNEQAKQVQAGRYALDCGSQQNAPDTNSARISRQSTNARASEKIRQGGTSFTSIGNYGRFGGWESFPTQHPVCSGDDGISRELDGITFSKWRNESIKAYGNAIVPQVALQIFRAIQEYETSQDLLRRNRVQG